jgi:hypothetical protein
MTSSKSKKTKISAGFADRLKRLEPSDKVHAIVLLRTGDVTAPPGRRQSQAEREAAIEAIRSSAGEALAEIDEILERTKGRRVAGAPDALGSIPVEATPAGIRALASSKWVKAIIEDQSIQLTFNFLPTN